MDWDLKMPAPWDIVSDQSYFTLPARPGPCAPTQPPRSPPSPNPLDLKLNNLSHTPIPVSKRARNGSTRGGRVAALCSVEGCKVDLGKCREYHRRHKVCEGHSKSPIVIVSGREQRFCQQCSRFHSLLEFDEAKRSCRKRLEGHNRRRRKPPNDNHLNPGVFFANNHQGSRFGSYQNLFAPVKPESISFSTPMYPTRRQFPFLMDESTPLPSDCALSLLSSPVMSSPVQSSSSIITTGTGIGTEHIPMAVPLVPGYQFGASGEFSGFMGGSGTATGTDRVSTFVVSSFGGNGEGNNFQSSFQSGAGEGSSHSVPFPSWH